VLLSASVVATFISNEFREKVQPPSYLRDQHFVHGSRLAIIATVSAQAGSHQRDCTDGVSDKASIATPDDYAESTCKT